MLVDSFLYQSPLGAIEATTDGEALLELRFVDATTQKTPQNAKSTTQILITSSSLPHPDGATALQTSVCRWLDAYFSHRQPMPVPPLRLQGTPFRLAVWKELLSIPYGQTISYAALAQRLSQVGGHHTSARAIGNAVAHNPIALIVPCHRVVGSNGQLTGYAYGIDRKRELLQWEQGGGIL